jgi:hypothetical protein
MNNYQNFQKLSSKILIILVATILTFIIFLLITQSIKIPELNNNFWLSILLLPVVLTCFHYRQKLSSQQISVLTGIMLGGILLISLSIILVMKANIANPPEWDFLGFWLNGKVAAQGLNFYQPEYARQLVQPFNPSTEFTTEIIDVGFWYPPPSIFIFLPLGWFDIHTAYLLWYVGHSIILFADIFLLWKIFLAESKLIGLLFIAFLLLALNAKSTIAFGQTNFLLLLMLILFWRDRNLSRGGIWLALGILVKPFLGGAFLYLLLRRKWRIITTTVIALSAISLLTLGVFGSETFFSYFKPSHYASLPKFIYTEITNQSLLATVLRLTKYDLSNTSPITHPIFVAIAIIITGITIWLVSRLDKRHNDLALALVIVLSLLIYPVSQMFYCIILIVPVLLLWKYSLQIQLKIWSVVAIFTLEYVMVNYSYGNYIFYANMLNWLILAGISFRLSQKPITLSIDQ